MGTGLITLILVGAAVAAFFFWGGRKTRDRRNRAADAAEKAVRDRMNGESRSDPSSSESHRPE